MSPLTHISIVHLACRLITGRKISLIYDLARGNSVKTDGTPDSSFISECNEKLRSYVPGFATECRYECTSGSGQAVEVFLNERTFIAHFRGTDCYFIGNIQRDIIYLYDQKANTHFKYRLTFSSDEEKRAKAAADSPSEDAII